MFLFCWQIILRADFLQLGQAINNHSASVLDVTLIVIGRALHCESVAPRVKKEEEKGSPNGNCPFLYARPYSITFRHHMSPNMVPFIDIKNLSFSPSVGESIQLGMCFSFEAWSRVIFMTGSRSELGGISSSCDQIQLSTGEVKFLIQRSNSLPAVIN